MLSTRWIKKDRIYKLKDSDGKILLEIEDRTGGGSKITTSFLDELASQYFEDLEKEKEI